MTSHIDQGVLLLRSLNKYLIILNTNNSLTLIAVKDATFSKITGLIFQK